MIFLLAVAIGIIIGAFGYGALSNQDKIVRIAGAVAGFIIGYAGTYIAVSNIPR